MDSDFGIMCLKACFSEMIVFGLEEMIFEVGTKVYSNNYHKAVNGVLAEKKNHLQRVRMQWPISENPCFAAYTHCIIYSYTYCRYFTSGKDRVFTPSSKSGNTL